MNVCVFGAASDYIKKDYLDKSYELAAVLAKEGHNLVFGGGDKGVMGAVARGFKENGAKVISVVPEFFVEANVEPLYEEGNEIIYTDGINSRKQKMEELSDAFVVCPGGIGTYEEFFEVLVLRQLERLNKKIAIFNVNGYFDALLAMLHTAGAENFLRINCLKLFKAFREDEIPELLEYIKQPYEDDKISVRSYFYGM